MKALWTRYINGDPIKPCKTILYLLPTTEEVRLYRWAHVRTITPCTQVLADAKNFMEKHIQVYEKAYYKYAMAVLHDRLDTEK